MPYWACGVCGFIFSTYMDEWTDAQFRKRIYNNDYIKADPPIPGRVDVPIKETPAYHKGKYIASFFPDARKEIRILDFGSGGDPGPTGLALIDEGFNVASYDPFRADTKTPEGRFDLIVAIEVFEHITDLKKLGAFMKEHLCGDGLIWIQTLIHPFPAPPNVLGSWYIAPRNGHVSIFSLHAMTLFLRSYGINVAQTSVGLFGFKDLPRFPNRIFVHA